MPVAERMGCKGTIVAFVVGWLVWFEFSVSSLARFVLHTELLSECGFLFIRGLAAGLVSLELAFMQPSLSAVSCSFHNFLFHHT